MSIARISNLWGKVTVFFVICCCSLSAQGKYGGGSGTPEDPYQIWDANHMQAIGADANDWDNCFKLMADIDLGQFTGTEFNIIGERYYDAGWVGHPFSGVFDGNNHTITNFKYSSTNTDYIGIFGVIYGEVRNLGLERVSVSGGWVVGGLVGRNDHGSVSNCYSTGFVSGYDMVGGLVGSSSGSVLNCYSTCDVNGLGSFIGGLVGYNPGIISNCYSAGDVSGDYFEIGGLVGRNGYYGTILNCYSTGDISGNDDVGGLVGYNDGSISNCFWDTHTQTHGVADSIGRDEGTAISVAGLPTAQMQTISTFTDAGWNFINVWNVGENQTYPYLRTYSAGDINRDGIVNFKDFTFMARQWLQDYNLGNQPPEVFITYPEDGERLMVGGVPPQTLIQAQASDDDGMVVRVEFFDGDLKLGDDIDGSDGWNYLWQDYSLGFHVLTATAWDNEGLSGTSPPVNVEVWMPDPPPP